MESHFRNARVLITGGLGFIGSTMAIRLADLGAIVTLVDSLIPDHGGHRFNIQPVVDRVIVNISDVRDPFAMRQLIKNQNYLFHLAGQTCHLDSMSDPFTDLEINCKAQLSILEACRLLNPGIRIVFASTRQIYGRPTHIPVTEDHPVQPVDINGIHKTSAEWYHLLYEKNYDISCSIVRLTNTYGPRMRVRDARQTFLGLWLRQLIHDQPLLIYGNGAQRRDLCYVEDVVSALLLAAISTAPGPRIYNVGGTEVISLVELASLLVELHGSGHHQFVPFPPALQKIDIGDYAADCHRIRESLGWRPQTQLREGLTQTLQYYYEHGSHYWT